MELSWCSLWITVDGIHKTHGNENQEGAMHADVQAVSGDLLEEVLGEVTNKPTQS